MTSRTVAQVADVLDASVPAFFRVGARQISIDDVAFLFPAERVLIQSAVDVRRAEFASGRVLLRSLLRLSVSIGRAENGAPILPPGWIGSLSHDRQIVIASVAPTGRTHATGVDIELADDRADDLGGAIVRPDDDLDDSCRVLGIKEATFKAAAANGAADRFDPMRIRVEIRGTSIRTHLLDSGLEFDVASIRCLDRWLSVAVAVAP